MLNAGPIYLPQEPVFTCMLKQASVYTKFIKTLSFPEMRASLFSRLKKEKGTWYSC